MRFFFAVLSFVSASVAAIKQPLAAPFDVASLTTLVENAGLPPVPAVSAKDRQEVAELLRPFTTGNCIHKQEVTYNGLRLYDIMTEHIFGYIKSMNRFDDANLKELGTTLVR